MEWTPCDRFGAGGLDRRQPVGEHRAEDVDHLPIAVVGAGELAPNALHRGRQHPVLERRAIAQGAGLTSEHPYRRGRSWLAPDRLRSSGRTRG